MVRSSLLSLGVGLLLAATPIAAQTTTTSSSSTTTTSSSSTSMTTTATTITSSTSSTGVTGSVPTAAPTNCVDGLQIFVARGSGEQPGLGRIGVVAGNITQKIKDSRVTAVDYPATFTEYNASVGNGTSRLKSLIEDYAKNCPNNKMALLGYSQGAQAVGDLICGTSSEGFPSTPKVDSRYEKNIVAIVLYGDPARAAGQSWNAGTATNQSSFFPRKNNEACSPYSANMRSWCDTGDRYCATGNQSEVHGSYFNKYEGETTKWVVDKFEKAKSSPAATTTNGNGNGGSSSSTSGSSTSGSSTNAATTTSAPPNSGATGTYSSGCPSACFALALGVAYLLAI
ncbi:hypothetical protein GGTG_03569 [Gaeumannomyces tritici R3-111a-1]|uniref:Acetylxylan esterase n=1 Tax=Gaeumannomyces tritici (strain R3-111a-1) TaxID=644352 RepID=J3NQL3_GAET3|nr:hypothetical protein GGTG_03569 [Gaeumannomyces tritici R3-111a-1]EJT78469.1 hypothetical protein GGTG_03569 [Gaeumannomyces tritici R3-111a-1]